MTLAFQIFVVTSVIVFGAIAAVRARIARRQLFQEFPDSAPPQPRFVERGASGRSQKSLSTRFGGANRCLEVIITNEELWIRIHPPFSYLSSGAEYDLMHRIPIRRIHTIKPLEKWVSRSIEIEFTDSVGDPHRLHLNLKKHDQFLQVLPPRAESIQAALLRPASSFQPDQSLLRSSTGSPAAHDKSLRPGESMPESEAAASNFLSGASEQ